MKSQQQIRSEIDASEQLPKFDRYPAVIECWNERELMWRTDNGRSYAHIVETSEYQYHLMYFNGRQRARRQVDRKPRKCGLGL